MGGGKYMEGIASEVFEQLAIIVMFIVLMGICVAVCFDPKK